ncbi:hypothetical protein ThrDRAFT_02122 [Frankia casuarinae]|nr:hypothetical protein ThrDRAFT_02122 [Frankia casuarinae]
MFSGIRRWSLPRVAQAPHRPPASGAPRGRPAGRTPNATGRAMGCRRPRPAPVGTIRADPGRPAGPASAERDGRTGATRDTRQEGARHDPRSDGRRQRGRCPATTDAAGPLPPQRGAAAALPVPPGDRAPHIRRNIRRIGAAPPARGGLDHPRVEPGRSGAPRRSPSPPAAVEISCWTVVPYGTWWRPRRHRRRLPPKCRMHRTPIQPGHRSLRTHGRPPAASAPTGAGSTAGPRRGHAGVARVNGRPVGRRILHDGDLPDATTCRSGDDSPISHASDKGYDYPIRAHHAHNMQHPHL